MHRQMTSIKPMNSKESGMILSAIQKKAASARYDKIISGNVQNFLVATQQINVSTIIKVANASVDTTRKIENMRLASPAYILFPSLSIIFQ